MTRLRFDQEICKVGYRYTNADLKISLNVCFHVKLIPWEFRILDPRNSGIIYLQSLQIICLQTYSLMTFQLASGNKKLRKLFYRTLHGLWNFSSSSIKHSKFCSSTSYHNDFFYFLCSRKPVKLRTFSPLTNILTKILYKVLWDTSRLTNAANFHQ